MSKNCKNVPLHPLFIKSLPSVLTLNNPYKVAFFVDGISSIVTFNISDYTFNIRTVDNKVVAEKKKIG